MTDLNFNSFKRYMDESHTEEGRERQRLASEAALIQHGRAYDLEVEDDDEAPAPEATLPPPLKRATQQASEARDDDPPPPTKAALTVDERWARLREEHGTWGHR